MRAAGVGGAVCLAAIGFLLFCVLFFGHGPADDSLFWIGGTAVLVVAVAVGGSLLGALPRSGAGRSGTLVVALLFGLAVWSGISILWSIEPDRSWAYLNRELVYVAFVVLGVYAGSLARVRVLAGALAILLGLVFAWALLGKIVPGLYDDYGRVARLRAPIGYWNALSLLGDATLPLGMWIAARRGASHRVRAAGVLLLYGAMVSMLLTYSRGGLVVGAVAVAVWLLIGTGRIESLAALGISAPAALLVFAYAHTLAGVAGNGVSRATRAHDGRLFAVALVVGAAAVVWAALRSARWEEAHPISDATERRFVRLAVGAVAGLVAGLLLVSLVRAGGPSAWVDARWHEFSSPAQLNQDPARLRSFSSNNRWTWWKEAANTFADHPVQGIGAGAFRFVHKPRFQGDSVVEPHNLALQDLAETGLVGFLLAIGAALCAVLAIRSALRRLEGDDRTAAAALAVGVIAYLLHALIDFDWDFVAVTAPVLLAIGALAAAGRPLRWAERPSLTDGVVAVSVLALSLGIVYSLVAPWLADRRVGAAISAAEKGDVAGWIAAAKEAHSLDPLSVDALFYWAAGETTKQTRASRVEAGRLYKQATELEPRNPDTWYQLGLYELNTLDAPQAAFRDLNRSYTLDRFGPLGQPCSPLDLARRKAEGKKFSCRSPQQGARP
jgi:tetratricopeptide (TPR) repeat protein